MLCDGVTYSPVNLLIQNIVSLTMFRTAASISFQVSLCFLFPTSGKEKKGGTEEEGRFSLCSVMPCYFLF